MREFIAVNTSVKNPLIAISISLGALFGLSHLNSSAKAPEEPVCQLFIDLPHISTYLKENKEKQAIKTNLRTECTQQQKSAKVWLELLTSRGKKDHSIEKYDPKTLESGFSPYVIKFKSFYTTCEFSQIAHYYYARARAQITLKSGRKIESVATSGKSLPLNCLPGTKIEM